jgi:broad specificity phosphatase PhoE
MSAGTALNKVFLVRHGETEWNLTLQHTSVTDIPLTDEGREKANELGERLRGREFALVLTSPLERSAETARLAGFPEAEPTDDLKEWNYGEYEGRTTAEIREQMPGWTIWSGGAPGGETADEVATRADRVIKRARETNGDVLLFSHGHFLRVLAARWIDLEPQGGRLFALGNASISVLGYERETPVLERWNT